MSRFIFDYRKMEDCLLFMQLDINDFNEDTLRKQYRTLAKKYHPDCIYDYYEKQKRTVLFQNLSNCYEYLCECVKCKNLWQSKVDINKKNTSNSIKNNRDKDYQNILNRLDRMIRPLNILLRSYCNQVNQHIIVTVLDDIEMLKVVARASEPNFDYGTLANYCDLLELFINRVFNIEVTNDFQIENNNYIGFQNDLFYKEKSEICLIEKQLLYEVLIKIIKFISTSGKYMSLNDYKQHISKYLKIIDDINDSIISFKWLLILPNIDKNKVNLGMDKVKSKKKIIEKLGC